MRLLVPGRPDAISGGHLYNREIARRAPGHGLVVDIGWLPPGRAAGPAALRRALAAAGDAVLVDSLAVAWLGGPARGVGIAHQPPGGLDGPRGRRRARRAADVAGYRRLSGVIATGDAVADDLAAAGVRAARIRVVHPGRRLVEAPGSVEDLRLGRRIALLCAASWLPRKGLVPLLRAVAVLPDDLVTVHLAGDESADRAYRRRVRRLLAHRALRTRVVVHGVVAPARLAALYAGADAFALPSRDEPWGMVYTEAMAAGLPVVGWRSGNLPRLCDDGREGLLAAPGDVAGLAGAIEALARDGALRARLGAGAVARAAAVPDWDAAASSFVDAVRELLGY